MQPLYLLAGSYAYDTVLQHPQAFRQRILPDELDKLNVSFHVESVVEGFGGCAGNIAYNAALLGDAPMLVGNLGYDGERYIERIAHWGLDTTTLGIVKDQPTAHAWMLTDERANQIISFHAGAMKTRVLARPYSSPTLWHIAPEDPVNMVKLAGDARESGSDYLFDPGQALPALLEGAERGVIPLGDVLQGAKGIFVNEYEAELLMRRRECLSGGGFVVKTRGAAGVVLYEGGRSIALPPATARAVVDPTGCGDAFRAGFLHAYVRKQPLAACVSLGAVMGALAVGSEGGQNHRATQQEIYESWDRYNDAHGIKTVPGTFDVLYSASPRSAL
ncbi:carbohydrate kinase family protein [Paraburkholderia sp. A2RO-4L]|uniref:carbohydrate kinase family protein n=1 Tax=Paraburkholderia sp. A2RO-4L TaxID=3028374 RepID=UPI0032F29644|nr:carbohydrate kinase family protein [Burkholderia vietnamiensis]